jgi:alanine racemase
MKPSVPHPTRVEIHLGRLTHNLRVLQSLVGKCPLWPAVKANAYGHGAPLVARHLLDLGLDTLCVAHATEAITLLDMGIRARYLLLSAALPEVSEVVVGYDLESAVGDLSVVQALSRAAERSNRQVSIHVKIDTGMGRVGIRPEAAVDFVAACQALPGVRVRGVMSHFPRADEADKSYSFAQTERFHDVVNALGAYGIEYFHMANSAAIFDFPEARFDAVRPGISVYGLRPSSAIVNAEVQALQPVLEWKSRITFLKSVPAGTGLSYGHTAGTHRDSLIATIPCGYGDGLSRRFSNNLEVLVGGLRCPLVGRVTMDQSLIDVTDVGASIALGDEVVILGRQGDQEITAEELAARIGTINYEIVTAISTRVPRFAV